jgi:hypothetical protein
MTESMPPTSQDLQPIQAGDLVTPELARRIAEDERRPWHRAKWLTTTLGQAVLAVALLAGIWMRDSEIIRDAILYLAALTGGGQLSQGWVDAARARGAK